jgi:hypothetical protein
MTNETAAPTGLDPKVPSPARIYDYYLGGKDIFAADRTAAEKALSVVPQGQEVAHSNRRFLLRAVRYMAGHGVAQFIDLGAGFPTPPSVHQTAAANLTVRPRVVYVDNDPMVTSHNQALLAESPICCHHRDPRRHPLPRPDLRPPGAVERDRLHPAGRGAVRRRAAFVRHEAPRCIPGLAGRNLEGCSWV